ncbi:MAG: hypothetical protein Kow0075_08250 [Salibacteraceae bacterium]
MNLKHKIRKYHLIYLVIHLSVFAYLYSQFQQYRASSLLGNYLFHKEGETGSYFEPIENLVVNGEYAWVTSIDRFGTEAYKPSTRRPPGFVPIYYPLRLIFSQKTTRDLLVIIQLTVYLIGIFALAEAGKILFRDSRIYHLIHLFSLICWYEKPFVFLGIADSLCTSLIMLGTYSLARYLVHDSRAHLIGFGIFSVWGIMLRPAAVALPLAFGLYLLFFERKKVLAYLKLAVPIIAIPVVVWGAYVYTITGYTALPEDDVRKSMPGVYPPARVAIYQVLKANGEPTQYWILGSASSYLIGGNDNDAFIEPLCFNEYDKDFFRTIKETFALSITHREDTALVLECDSKLTVMCNNYVEDYKSEFPLRYFVLNKFKALYKFLHIKTYTFLPLAEFSKLNVFQKLIRLQQVAIVYVLYLLSLITLVIRGFELKWTLWIYIGVYLGIHIALLTIEPRYLLPIFPAMYVLASLSALYLVNRLLERTRIHLGA